MEALINQLKTLALTDALPFLIKLGGALVLWFVGRAVISGFQRVLHLTLQKRKLDATLIRYVESLFTGVLTILLLLGLLGLMGVETTSFAALLAAAGIAIGSAWSGLLSNFAAGVFLLVLRPFRVGEEINAGGVTGIVQEIGLFVTAIDTPDNLRIFVGNSRLLGDNIINLSHHPHRRAHHQGAADPWQRRRTRSSAPWRLASRAARTCWPSPPSPSRWRSSPWPGPCSRSRPGASPSNANPVQDAMGAGHPGVAGRGRLRHPRAARSGFFPRRAEARRRVAGCRIWRPAVAHVYVRP